MKKKYFKFVKIDNDKLSLFLEQHPQMKKFIDVNQPFYVRVSLKPYPSLIHHILCGNLTSREASIVASKLESAAGKISPRRVNKISESELINITSNPAKAILIQKITHDILSKKINLKKLVKLDTNTIINTLGYLGLNSNTLKQFALFGCFKQDVLCEDDPHFLEGLKIYLNKQDITKQDIISIKQEYQSQLTLFSLCMWRIVNERE